MHVREEPGTGAFLHNNPLILPQLPSELVCAAIPASTTHR
jgi:hypothetical protein